MHEVRVYVQPPPPPKHVCTWVAWAAAAFQPPAMHHPLKAPARQSVGAILQHLEMKTAGRNCS